MVLLVTTIIGGTIALMAKWSVQGYQTRQADQARLIAHALTDSAAAYARAHLPEWSARPPEASVTLDMTALLPPHATGSAVITFDKINDRQVCKVTGAAQIGPAGASDEIDLIIPSAAETQPAARP